MAIDYVKIGILLSRTCLALTLLLLGIDTFGDAGERTYNKYLHSLRKMYLRQSKPSDPSFIINNTWNELNIKIIYVLAGLFILSSIFLVLNKKV